MTDYSHLSTPELNQLIHDLSITSRGRYEKERRGNWIEGRLPWPNCDTELGIDTKPYSDLREQMSPESQARAKDRHKLLDELVRESEALGLYTSNTNEKPPTSL